MLYTCVLSKKDVCVRERGRGKGFAYSESTAVLADENTPVEV